MEWLRKLTFQDVHGVEKMVDDKRETRPSFKILTYVNRRNRLRFLSGSDRKKYVGRFKVPNYKYRDHFDKKSTYYFFAHPTARVILVMIDIDVQKSKGLGTPEGAVAFAKHLKRFWPDLYSEPSTGGKGVHCYVLVQRAGQDARAVNAYLKKLQDWLRAEQQSSNADIEVVEVKGTCPVIDLAPDGKVESVRYGTFAKIPRQAEERFGELAATTVLDIDKPLPMNSGPVFKLVGSNGGCGSWDGRFISEEEVAAIPANEQFYKNLGLGLRDARYLVSANDFAIFCVLLRWFTDHPVTSGKKKDTLPVRKCEGLWNALHEAGIAERPFNCHRFKVIRDYLSKNRHIDWIDHRYQWSNRDAVGQVVQEGIACKWRLTAHFMGLLERVSQTGGGDFVVIDEFKKGTGEWRTPIPCPIEVVDERAWLAWAEEELENWPLAA
jgi:hypothetical protein